MGLATLGAAHNLVLSLLAPASAAAAPAAGFFSHFDGLKLQDQDGRRLDAAWLASHIVLVNFVFTGCSSTCPLQTRALADMHQRLAPSLRSRVRMLSVSLDPLNDSPAVLKAYARRMGADQPAWRFVSGRPQDIERLSDVLRLFRTGSQVRKPDDHSTAVWLIDGAGDIRMRYAGNPPDVPRLLRELAALDQLERGAHSR